MRLSDEGTASMADSTESLCGPNLVNDDPNLFEDRFRVDRRKLEEMLQGQSAMDYTGETAERFFQRIMEETNTSISWPSKLKVGAKSKKDPHIKIIGDQDAVILAREKVLEQLDTKRNRVTLKMDVSFTDHSHIIGKGGHNIRQVMEETGCHIHFPDSNRNTVGEKSNQVSIAGQTHGVEKAKCRIRELLPLVISFDLPSSTSPYPQNIPDVTSAPLQLIQHTYCFTISIRPKPRGGSITVVVRGCRRQVNQIRQGLLILMGYLTGNNNTVLPVTVTLEVPSQHQSFLMGRGNANVQSIMKETGATITFPDVAALSALAAFNPNLSQLPRKSTVTLSGHFDSVYVAWQEIMGYLPLVLMFDLKEGQELDTGVVTKLMDHYNVNIIIRPKPKQNTKSILVRGAEKDSRYLFEVRRVLLDLDKSEIPHCCDKHSIPIPPLAGQPVVNHNPPPSAKVYHHPRVPEFVLPAKDEKIKPPSTLNELASFSQGNPLIMNNRGFPAPPPALQTPFINVPPPPTPNPVAGGSNPLLPWIMSQLATNPSNFYGALLQAQIGFAAQQQISEMALGGLLHKTMMDMNVNPSSRGSTPSDQMSSSCTASSGSGPNSGLTSPVSSSPCESPIFMTSDGSCYSQYNGSTDQSYSGSTDSLSIEKDSQSSWNSTYWLGDRPDYKDVSLPASKLPNYEQDLVDATKVILESNIQGRTILPISTVSTPSSPTKLVDSGKVIGTVGCERKTRFSLGQIAEEDYTRKKLQAVKAMNEPVSSAARIPTDVWAGCGFSKSMPHHLLKNKLELNGMLPKRSETLQEVESGPTRVSADTWKQLSEEVLKPQHGCEGATASVDSIFSYSNFFDAVMPKPSLMIQEDIQDLTQLFTLLGLEKFLEVFRQQQVDLLTFLTLTEKDLNELGIPFSARRKMLMSISELKNKQEAKIMSRAFPMAPGAERRAIFARQQNQTLFDATGKQNW